MVNKCVECTPESPCTAVQLIQQQQEQDNERVDKLEGKLDFFEDCLKNRLPLWATFVLTGFGGAVGVLTTLLAK